MENNKAINWYTLRVFSQKEHDVIQAIINYKNDVEIGEYIFDAATPMTKKMIKRRGGTQQLVDRVKFPGYVFVKMIITDVSRYKIRNTEHVINFIGGEKNPIPIKTDDVRKLELPEEGLEIPKDYKSGDRITIINGPFENFEGTVDVVNDDNVKAIISIMGKDTPLTLNYEDIEKIG